MSTNKSSNTRKLLLQSTSKHFPSLFLDQFITAKWLHGIEDFENWWDLILSLILFTRGVGYMHSNIFWNSWALVFNYLWLWTLFPAIKLPQAVPRTVNMHLAMSTFLNPWSARTLKEKDKVQNNIFYCVRNKHNFHLFFITTGLFYATEITVNECR